VHFRRASFSSAVCTGRNRPRPMDISRKVRRMECMTTSRPRSPEAQARRIVRWGKRHRDAQVNTSRTRHWRVLKCDARSATLRQRAYWLKPLIISNVVRGQSCSSSRRQFRSAQPPKVSGRGCQILRAGGSNRTLSTSLLRFVLRTNALRLAQRSHSKNA